MQSSREFDFSLLNILVCAELEFARRLITDMCLSLRFNSVVSKRDFAGAWETFTTLPIDIVIGDIGSDDGMRFLKAVRNIDISPNLVIPFIAMSAASSKPSVARARRRRHRILEHALVGDNAD
jgi:CheY-like chemotaxis protein